MAEENMLDESMQGMLYTLEDEEGNEQEFEVLGEMEYEGANYCALIPYYENEEDLLKDDGEFVVVVKGWDASLLRILILRFGESYRNDILRGLRLCEVYR